MMTLSTHRRRHLLVAVAAAVAAIGLAAPASAARTPNGAEDFVQLASQGFAVGVDGPHPEGSRSNNYSWAGAWFRGRLLIGTNRNIVCFIGIPGTPGCPANGIPRPVDAAEMWSYTPAGQGGIDGRWKRVFVSPEAFPTAIPGAPRDVGFRGMRVCSAGGTKRLWVGSFGLGGRVLWSDDGLRFEPTSNLGLFNSAAEVASGVADFGIRALACWKGRLFAAPAGSRRDPDVPVHPVLFMNDDPTDPLSEWETAARLKTQPGVGDVGNIAIFEMQVFKGALYLGISNRTTGLEVWKGTGCEPPPGPCEITWKKVVDNGAGRPIRPGGAPDNGGVLSMAGFNGALYLGVSESASRSPLAELIRIHPDDTYELVVGQPRNPDAMPDNFVCNRSADGSTCQPLSGYGAGFGGPPATRGGYARYVWRLAAHEGYLYAGTLDRGSGSSIENPPGFDLWRSRDGVTFSHVDDDGLGNRFNYGIRTLLSVKGWPGGPALVLGTANPYTSETGANGGTGGLEIWVGTCAAPPGDPTAIPGPVLADYGVPGVQLVPDTDQNGSVDVRLDGSASYDPACGRIVRYEWYEGDVSKGPLGAAKPFATGKRTDVELPTGSDFTDYTFTLRVIDEDGAESRAPITFRASHNRPPTVEYALDPAPSYQGGEYFLTILDFDRKGFVRLPLGGTCTDPEQKLVSCGWTATPGITIVDPGTPYTTAVIPVQGYSLGSRRTIRLTAVDDHGYRTVVAVNVSAFAATHAISLTSIVPAAPAVSGVEQQVIVTVTNSGNYVELVDVSLVDESGGQVSPLVQPVSIPAGGQVTVVFAWQPTRPGPHVLAASAGPVQGETNVADNVLRATFEVASG